jgi:hypothetical protein
MAAALTVRVKPAPLRAVDLVLPRHNLLASLNPILHPPIPTVAMKIGRPRQRTP